MSDNTKMTYSLSVRLFKDEKCFGPGIAQLLSAVDEKKSLRSAAAQMGMAYSKAWRIVKQMESILGFKLLERSTGGKNGGGASLTKQAADMLNRYNSFMTELRAHGDMLFEKYFSF